MSMHPKGPLPKKQQQVQDDLRDAETIKCEDCNNYKWIQLMMDLFLELFQSFHRGK